MKTLIDAAKELIDSVSSDNARHGGLLSRETTRRADEVNRILRNLEANKAVEPKEPPK